MTEIDNVLIEIMKQENLEKKETFPRVIIFLQLLTIIAGASGYFLSREDSKYLENYEKSQQK